MSGYVMALGMFDGVHIGHKALLEKAVEEAKKLRCPSMAFCFENQPASLFGKGGRPLSTPGQRKLWMEKIGIDRVEMIPFTQTFAAQSPEAFVHMLQERYGIKALVVGFNYTFGKKAEGNSSLLLSIGEREGIPVFVIPPVLYEGLPVSSTRIRQALEKGDLSLARQLLGREIS